VAGEDWAVAPVVVFQAHAPEPRKRRVKGKEGKLRRNFEGSIPNEHKLRNKKNKRKRKNVKAVRRLKAFNQGKRTSNIVVAKIKARW